MFGNSSRSAKGRTFKGIYIVGNKAKGRTFLPPLMCVSGGKKCWFFGTPVLGLDL